MLTDFQNFYAVGKKIKFEQNPCNIYHS